MGKTPLIVAPLIVLAAVLFGMFWAGRWWERVNQRYASRFISAKTHQGLVELVRRMLSPTDIDQGCFLPEPVRVRAQQLVDDADRQDAARRREELRRRIG